MYCPDSGLLHQASSGKPCCMLPLILPSFLPYHYIVCIGSRCPVAVHHSLNHGNNGTYLQMGYSGQTADRLSFSPVFQQKAGVSVPTRIADKSGSSILLQMTDRLIRHPASFWRQTYYRKHTLYFAVSELYPRRWCQPDSYLRLPEDRSRRTSFHLSGCLRKYLPS